MRVQDAIDRLLEIKERWGNLPITGGYLTDDSSLEDILVVDSEGYSVGLTGTRYNGEEPAAIEGVYFQA